MRRYFMALAAVAALAAAAHAQPYPPAASTTIPIAPIPTLPGPNSPSMVFVPVIAPWGWGVGWAYQTYNPWTGYSYMFGGVLPPGPSVVPSAIPAIVPTGVTTVPVIPIVPAVSAAPTVTTVNTVNGPQSVASEPVSPGESVALSGESPAVLTLQFPAKADVWLDGKKAMNSVETHTLQSPALQPGQSYTFDVKARWKSGGKTYETTRSVVLGPGDRSRLLIVSGEEVK
jgi:uncharacterized protein (TIGR03000 family)